MYKYDLFDPQKNKTLYQYSNFEGKKFIKNFFISRKKFTKILKKTNLNQEYNLLKKKKIYQLCRSFEINKRIYFDKNKKKEYELRDYIRLSNQIFFYLNKKIDYSILSTLLKINDYISFCCDKKKIDLEIKKVFQNELIIVKRVINAKIR